MKMTEVIPQGHTTAKLRKSKATGMWVWAVSVTQLALNTLFEMKLQPNGHSVSSAVSFLAFLTRKHVRTV